MLNPIPATSRPKIVRHTALQFRITPFTGNNQVQKCASLQELSEILDDRYRGSCYEGGTRTRAYDALYAMTENDNSTNYNINDFADVKGLMRERPWLLPSVSTLVCIDISRAGALAETVKFVSRTESCGIFRGFHCAT